MQDAKQLGSGLVFAAISIIIVVGIFALALAENGPLPGESATLAPTTVTFAPLITIQAGKTATQTPPGVSQTPAITITPTPTACPAPIGWLSIIIQPFDTLQSLASRYLTSTETLRINNCLNNNELTPGATFYIPPGPTATLIPCGAPLSWINYTVRPGDTLYQISLLYSTNVPALQQANCLGYNTIIKIGQILKVPNVATITSIPATITTAPTSTASETSSPTVEIPTETPTQPGEVPTVAPTETPGETSVPTATDIPTPTAASSP